MTLSKWISDMKTLNVEVQKDGRHERGSEGRMEDENEKESESETLCLRFCSSIRWIKIKSFLNIKFKFHDS